MPQVEDFFLDLDRVWTLPSATPLTLRLLGSTALLLQTDYTRGTKDGDILETTEITPLVSEALLRLAGRGTELHRRHRLYLEVLAAAFPFLPEAPTWRRPASFSTPLTRLRLEVLDPLDVVIAKLARFHTADQEDIAAMVKRDLVDPMRFTARFRSAVRRWWHDARADDLPGIVRNFHRVQTDELFVGESEIELPSWVDED